MTKIAQIESPNTEAEVAVPRWKLYQHILHPRFLPAHSFTKTGKVCFAGHLGKPLSPKLWTDLVFLLRVERLRVMYLHEETAVVGLVGSYAIIVLGPTGLVLDIEYQRV